jgi:hypothetical protein
MKRHEAQVWVLTQTLAEGTQMRVALMRFCRHQIK